MSTVFSHILDMSVSGSIVILAVLVLRLILRKAPRSAVCLLWLLAGLRLALPFQLESDLSIQPAFTAPVSQQISTAEPPEMVPAIPDPDTLPDDVVISTLDDAVSQIQPISVTNVQGIASIIWACGVVCMLGWSVIAWVKLKQKLNGSVIHSEGIWISGRIETAFVFGLFRPRIYLPAGVESAAYGHILAHEHSHIRRGDHLWKPLGFAILALHWFNPLVWAAYVLLCRDMETACDERVIRNMDPSQRKSYSAALLACSARQHQTFFCPVAFGEASVKERILNVLNYRKPKIWAIFTCCAALVFVTVCLLTSPKAGPLELCRDALESHQAHKVKKIETVTEYSGEQGPQAPMYINYWYSEGSCLSRWQTAGSATAWLLQHDGSFYCQGIKPFYPESVTDYTQWAQSENMTQADLTCWLDEYRWDPRQIALLSTEEESGNTLVTFRIKEAIADNAGGPADQRTVTFCINGGALIYAIIESTTEGILNGIPYSVTSRCTMTPSYDKSEILGILQGRISEASHLFPET